MHSNSAKSPSQYSFKKYHVTLPMSINDDDGDFQNPIIPLSQTTQRTLGNNNSSSSSLKQPLKPSNTTSILRRPKKKHKSSSLNHSLGKENIPPFGLSYTNGCEFGDVNCCSLDSIPSSFDECGIGSSTCRADFGDEIDEKEGLKKNGGYLSKAIESRILNSRLECEFNESTQDDFVPGTQLGLLLNLCCENEEGRERVGRDVVGDCLVLCPLCQTDISYLTDKLRQVHTNNCLDNEETKNVVTSYDDPELEMSRQDACSSPVRLPGEFVDVSPVIDWLCNLGLGKYEEDFIREEIDWDTLLWLSEEDLVNVGVTALGPRKKIVHALNELRRGTNNVPEIHGNVHSHTALRKQVNNVEKRQTSTSNVIVNDSSKSASNKLITDFFPGPVATKSEITNRSETRTCPEQNCIPEKGPSDTNRKRAVVKVATKGKKDRDIPLWCCIPGTQFRVDAFQFLRRDCSHWFLSHFHMDHYQGLTKSFSHGKIYCSLITAKLVNLKIGIPWDKLQVLPLNEKICIAGIDVTCFDANHCPGSIIILFEPPNGKAVLHTGDFRFSETMAALPVLQSNPVHTLILDTTYCNPQYDFPKQESVIQFVIEAIQAEAFNPKTLFLIGSYTIGKERLFMEVARVLRKKIYVNAPKFRLLKCLEFSDEDTQWLTINEHESHIHVVPMWTLASFKRMKHISNQYASRFNLIVAFSPTGWTFGKGKKKTTGRRWQQGTLIRYEVPYSEHSSFTELKEFVKSVSPLNIIPSVNNDGPESATNMVSLLLS